MYKCTKCNKKYFNKYNFCPECGSAVETYKIKLFRNKDIKYLTIGITVMIVAIVLIIALFKVISGTKNIEDNKKQATNSVVSMVEGEEVTKQEIYDQAVEAYNNEKYDEAIPLFDSVNSEFEDAKYYKSICRYYVALNLMEEGDYYEAQQQLDKVISSSLDSINILEGEDINTLSAICCPKIVEEGLKAFGQRDYQKAYDYLKYASRKPQYVDITQFEHEDDLLKMWDTTRGKWLPIDSVNNDYIQITDTEMIVSSSKLHSGTYGYILKSITDYDKYLGYQTYDYLVSEDGIIRLKLTSYGRGSSSEFEDTQNGSTIKMYLEGSSYLETQKKIEEYKAAQEKKEPQIGMTQEEVKASTWGSPTKVNKTTYRWGVWEQWCYPNYKYIYFENGYVTIISE